MSVNEMQVAAAKAAADIDRKQRVRSLHRQGRAGQGRAGQGRAGQGRALSCFQMLLSRGCHQQVDTGAVHCHCSLGTRGPSNGMLCLLAPMYTKRVTIGHVEGTCKQQSNSTVGAAGEHHKVTQWTGNKIVCEYGPARWWPVQPYISATVDQVLEHAQHYDSGKLAQ